LAEAEGFGSQPAIRLTTDLRLGFEGTRATARTMLKEGDQRFVAMAWSEHEGPSTVEEAYRRLVWTAHHWQHWLARGTFPDHPWRSHLERSALTLKGLTFGPSGALLAAPTTSLPETPGGERNWDYRFTWIRDSTLALWALDTLGFDWEADDFFCFIADVAERSDELQIMYGVDTEKDLSEELLKHLHGYMGSRPVRVGNGAFEQRQHDVWGALLDSVYIHTASRDGLDDRMWPILSHFVEAALEHWQEPDRGIWEVRGEPKHFTSSKVMCWVAADRGARLARLREDYEVAERWQRAADEMHADICANGVDERGVFVQYYGTRALDASTLLIPLVQFLPPDDARVRATVNAIDRELTEQGLVLRYRVEQTDDGLSGEEGSFTICSFWLVSALAMIGEHARARKLCEKLLSFASPLGLYAEEIDPSSGQHLGNFPQAFTHLGLINAVLHVIAAEEEPAAIVRGRRPAGESDGKAASRGGRATGRGPVPVPGGLNRNRTIGTARSARTRMSTSGGGRDWISTSTTLGCSGRTPCPLPRTATCTSRPTSCTARRSTATGQDRRRKPYSLSASASTQAPSGCVVHGRTRVHDQQEGSVGG